MALESAQQFGWILAALAVGMALLQWRYMRSMTLYSPFFGFSERLEVSREVRRLPLGAMLRRRGIGLDRFMLGLKASEVHTVTRDCRACGEFDRCVSTLADEPTADDYSFCANDATITRIAGTRPD